MLQRTVLLTVGLVAAAGAAQAASFKPRYYADCYAPVAAAREMVPPPPTDIGGTAKKAGEVAGTIGKLGGFVPGLGGLGGLGRAAQTANQVATYSGYVADAAAFSKKMQEDYPDAAARLAAYGDKMGEDADKIGEATLKVNEGQACYEKAFTDLKAGIESKEIKGRDISRRQKEIQEGLEIAGDVLSDSRKTMDKNMESYNEAMTSEESGMGVNFASLAQSAAARKGLAAAAGTGAVGPYAAYYTQTNAYTDTWWQTYNATGDANAAKQAALAASSGTMAVKPYQEAYWNAAATQAQVTGQPISSSMPQVNLGTINALRGMSGGGAAWVGANIGVGLLADAIHGNKEEAAPAEAPPAPQLSPAMQDAVMKTSADTSKFTDAYGLVSLTNSRQSQLADAVKAKLD